MPRAAFASVLLLVFFVLAPLAQASTPVGDLISPTNPATSVEDMFNKINALRQSRGLAALTINSALTAAAQEQADYISNTGIYAHVRNGSSPRTRAQAAGYQTNVWCCSENTHRTQVGKSAWEFWNYSRSHYYNMINPDWTEIGVATSNVGPWTGWVMVFGSGIQTLPADAVAQPAVEVAPAAPLPAADLAPAAPVEAVPPPATHAVSVGTTHRVVWGDTLFGIARRYGVSVSDIVSANALSGNIIYQGQELVIPGAGMGSASVSTSATQPAPAPATTADNGALIAAIASPAPGAVVQGSFPIIGTAYFDPAQASYYKLEIMGGAFGTGWVTIGETHRASVIGGALESLPPIPPGSYTLRLVIVGLDGNHLSPSPTVPFTVQ